MSRVRRLLAAVLERRTLLGRIGAGGWMLLIFTLSSIPDPGIPHGMATPGHAGLYFVLGVLLLLGSDSHPPTYRAAAIAILIASAYGLSDEFHQAFVPGRMPDIMDWATDTIGGAVGAVTSAWLLRRYARD